MRPSDGLCMQSMDNSVSVAIRLKSLDVGYRWRLSSTFLTIFSRSSSGNSSRRDGLRIVGIAGNW